MIVSPQPAAVKTTPANLARCQHCSAEMSQPKRGPVRQFCSAKCRMAAHRASKDHQRASDSETRNSENFRSILEENPSSEAIALYSQGEKMDGGANLPPLGNKTTEFRSPLRPAETSFRGKRDTVDVGGREARSKQRRARRYTDRRTLWKITNDRTCASCGRTVMDPDSGLILAQTAEGNALLLGLFKCGKIWFCPVCSAKIRHGRAQEITKGLVFWIRQGGIALLITGTARHAASHQLATLMDAIQGTRADEAKGLKRKPGAYQRLITGAAWAGDKRRAANQEGIRGRVGYIGMIRATEVTVGIVNGWHPHIHAIVLIGGITAGGRGDKRVTGTFTPSEEAMKELEDHFRGVWTRHLAKIDPNFKPSDEHGMDFKRLETVQDAENFGQYIAKIQDGDKSISPVNEIARGDLKQGRNGNMTPFQMLGRIGDLMAGVPEEDATGEGTLEWCLAKWHESETALKGRRAIEWTRGLRSLLGLDGGDSGDDDMDLLFEGDDASQIRAGVHIQTDAWHQVAQRALDLTVIETVEGKQLDLDAVTAVITAAGAAPDSVRLLTPGEISEVWEGVLAKLAERRESAVARRQVERARAQTAGKLGT